MNSKSEEQIKVRAYELWQLEGCPKGCDKAHWYQAERELLQSQDLSLTAAGITTKADNGLSRSARVPKTARSRNSSPKQRGRVAGATQVTLN